MSLYDDASLVMIPSGYKDGKLYSVKPSDGAGDFTFTRGSNLAATRVDEDGLIEKGRENLLLQSNSFDTTWTTSNASVTSGQSGYDGSSDAWLLSKSGASGFVQQTKAQSGVVTQSVYVKANTSTWCYMLNGSGFRYFDLTNGVIGNGGADIDSSIQSIGNGWYRVSLVTNGCSYFRLYPAEANSNSATSGSIYIQDAQLEAGLVATDYIETGATTAQAGILEDMPRLDYSGGTCPALLLEPQRTNLVTQSEYFDDAAWSKTRITITANDTTAPDGTTTADKLIPSVDVNSHFMNETISSTTNAIVLSCFVKLDGSSSNKVTLYPGSSATFANFDLSNLTSLGEANVLSTEIIDFGNGWYRLVASYPSGLTYNQFRIYNSSGIIGASTIAGNGTDGIFIWGAQLEEGSYATSYIPTYGTSVTRNEEDVFNTSTSGIIGQVDGVIYLEMSALSDDGTFRQVTLSDGTSNNLIHFDYSSSSNGLRVFTRTAGVASSFTYTMIDTTSNAKFALKYADNDYRLFINGVKVTTDTSCLTPLNLSDIEFDNGSGSNNLEARLNQFMLFPTALSDADCIARTTL